MGTQWDSMVCIKYNGPVDTAYGTHWWQNSWYAMWIETNITIGSVIKIWKTNGTIVGSIRNKLRLNGQDMLIDCWVVHYDPSINYTAFFDKQTGIMVELVSSYAYPDHSAFNLTLVSTNIPIGLLYEEEIQKYFPHLIFDKDEKYYPTNFLFDDNNITNNPSSYNLSWPKTVYVHTVTGTYNEKDYLVIEYWFYYVRDSKVWDIELPFGKVCSFSLGNKVKVTFLQ